MSKQVHYNKQFACVINYNLEKWTEMNENGTQWNKMCKYLAIQSLWIWSLISYSRYFTLNSINQVIDSIIE